jgi:hypothetical protein
MSPAAAQADIQSTDYPSLRDAIDAHPGRTIYVPNGDHKLTETVMIKHSGTGLCGPGRLVMTDPSKDIINVHDVNDITFSDIKLTRPQGKGGGSRNGIHAERIEGLTIDGVSVTNNGGENAGLKIERCKHVVVRNCLVRDYKAVTVDDRTRNPNYGYAFKCIDGNGMKFVNCQSAQITNNRIIETALVASKENRDKYDLGRVTVLPDKPGLLAPRGLKENPNMQTSWHQGSALFFGHGDGDAQYSVISGNYIEGAAQGLDIHADYITITGNIVNGATLGVKATHGSKHVIISNNQFSRCDLYGIAISPGAAAHGAIEANGDRPAQGPNVDAGTVVTGNIISDYGFGDQYWNFNRPETSIYAISLERGQEPDDPPLRDVVIANNIVYDTGRDEVIVDGKPEVVPPRYRLALHLPGRVDELQNVKIYGNIFHPGSSGVSNVEVPPQ